VKSEDLRKARGLSAVDVAASPTVGYGVSLDPIGRIPGNVPVMAIQVLTADPTNPGVGAIWYRSDTSQLCVRHNATTTKRVSLT